MKRVTDAESPGTSPIRPVLHKASFATDVAKQITSYQFAGQ